MGIIVGVVDSFVPVASDPEWSWDPVQVEAWILTTEYKWLIVHEDLIQGQVYSKDIVVAELDDNGLVVSVRAVEHQVQGPEVPPQLDDIPF